MMGCKAAAGIPVSQIAEEFHSSRQYVYQQKRRVLEDRDSMDMGSAPVPVVPLDECFIKRMV